MSNDIAVRLSKYPLKHILAPPAAATSFTGTVPFAFTSLSTLDQMEDGGYVDLLGRVVHVDPSQLMNALPKKSVTIANGDYYETVELLGNHAALNVVENQVIACRGLTLRTWKGTRTCTTTLLSYIWLDPDARVGKVAQASTDESPRKKATVSKYCPRLTTLLIRDAAARMNTEYEQNPTGPLPTATYMVRGHLAPITMGSLSGCPTFEKNGIARIRFLADVYDTCGCLQQVTV